MQVQDSHCGKASSIFLVHAAEAAIAHHQDMVARLRRRANRLHQSAELVEGVRHGAQRRQRIGQVPAQRLLAVP